MKNMIMVIALSVSASLTFAGTVENATGVIDTVQQAKTSESKTYSAIVLISNGVAPQDSLGELIRKESGTTMAVWSSSVQVNLFQLRKDCDYAITYKEISGGIHLTSIEGIAASCGQARLQAR